MEPQRVYATLLAHRYGQSILRLRRGYSWNCHVAFAAKMGTSFSAMLLSSGLQHLNVMKAFSEATPPTNHGRQLVVSPPCYTSHSELVDQNPVTKPYKAKGYFTGIQSSVAVPQSSKVVFESLAKDLQHIFGPITECTDILTADDGMGWQRIQRKVKIPFSISYFSGSLHLKLDIENDRNTSQISIKSASQGRFLSDFVANFHIIPLLGADGSQASRVLLDSRVVVKKLPPPPLKNLIKGMIVRKMDRCMRDLAAYHVGRLSQAGEACPDEKCQAVGNILPVGSLQRFLKTNQRGQRRSLL